MTHIFLRNVSLGMSRNQTIFWLDDQIFSSKYLKYDRWINMTKKRKVSDARQDQRFIMKSMSVVA